MADFPDHERPHKRARLSDSTASTDSPPKDEYSWSWPAESDGPATKAISPPPVSRNKGKEKQHQEQQTITESSPFQLTRIRDLPASANVDTVTLSDILGEPMIKEQWQFNFLLDIDFIMSHLDEDVRDTVQTKIIHGFHEKNSLSRISLEETAKKYPNVQALHTWIPAYGTHHSKMMILIRHDDTAQVVIHTANMISQDWTNLSQAVWRSPLLPLSAIDDSTSDAPMGSGARFKQDLLNYLEVYKDKYRDHTRPLINQLKKYDFSSVKAALVASVPGKQQIGTNSITKGQSLWGWPGLERVLKQVPSTASASKAQINVQISSVGTAPEKWLDGFFDVLGTTTTGKQPKLRKPSVRVIFPTADEIRRSLDGYRSGSSIHMKLDSQMQKLQFKYMKPLLCTWAGDAKEGDQVREAGRRRAAPHIKTFIRFSDDDCNNIDWTLVTSANLSKQAWGEMANKQGDVNIKSFEIGVLVCPQWLAEDGQKAVMVPVFKKDKPEADAPEDADKKIGVRMPYDLPLTPYLEGEEPWCAERSHAEPDWQGVAWQGFNPRV
ncbi:phospholipase D/nuclease [Aureobasidium pullulans]|uniref:Phospholipase D/nuclease n=1 Tax=Aureobasidium pullulans TaxID=5580 RepID=A0AB74IPV9_AURPU|nr:phospholipase D/nuclease [Aureobasidium pullulans]THX77960.1 phospholipase D/nuclease [Aureobasidium pullulans]THY55287.1 phospholipase D/nuclease [Aureobasidium pullulans]